MKACFKCGVVRPLTDFYKHPQMADGHLGKCKECTKKDALFNRIAEIEHYRQYDRMRAAQPHRMKKAKSVVSQYKADFPNRVKAMNAVNNAVRDGRLQKWPCQVCGNEKSVGHHADYGNHLGVVWLCQAHHKQAHALEHKLKEAA